jgi:hypothetical protein
MTWFTTSSITLRFHLYRDREYTHYTIGQYAVCLPNGDEARHVSVVPLACALIGAGNCDADAFVSSTPGSSEVRHRTKFSESMSP